jgi:hypothetical protein
MNTLKFLIVVSIALLSTDLIYHQVVNGQNTSSSMVDKLIEDTQNKNNLTDIYDSELIKMIERDDPQFINEMDEMMRMSVCVDYQLTYTMSIKAMVECQYVVDWYTAGNWTVLTYGDYSITLKKKTVAEKEAEAIAEQKAEAIAEAKLKPSEECTPTYENVTEDIERMRQCELESKRPITDLERCLSKYETPEWIKYCKEKDK